MTIEKLRKLNSTEIITLNGLINKLESEGTHDNAKSLAPEIHKCLADGYISSKLKVRIEGYCKKSNDRRGPTREIVRDISVILFGKELTEYD